MYRIILIWFVCFFSIELKAQYIPRLNFNAKYEPVDKILHGAGQADEIEFANYLEVLGNNKHPIIYMLYTSASRSEERQILLINQLKQILKNYPNDVIPQIGLSFTGSSGEYANKVIDSTYDKGLIILAKSLDSLKRPIFVRIGYEANGFWNAYKPDSYKKAYIHISKIFKKYASNVANVWCIHPIDNMTTIMKFYPGDAHCDWWSIDLFENYHVTSLTTKSFLDSSVAHQRPVMMGESTPTKSGIGNGQQSWDSWYKLYFNIIKNYGVIKAFCYINRNWTQTVSWPDWKDSRLQKDSIVARLYKEELSNPIYKHAKESEAKIVKTIEVVEDSYVRNGEFSKINYSSKNELYVQNSVQANDQYITFLKFNISRISNITRADLWLCGTSDSIAQGNVDIFEVDNNVNWDESTITWSNKPTIIYPKLGSISPNENNRISFRSHDLTQSIKAQRLKGLDFISLAISNPSIENVKFYFQSKEMPISNTAELVIFEDILINKNAESKKLRNIPMFLYPNPSQDNVSFLSEFINEVIYITITDLAGKELKTFVKQNEQFSKISFSLEGIPAGLYILKIYDNKFYNTQKLLIK